MRTLRQDYDLQRRGAGYRGIAFLLTFEEWLDIWESSGHLPNRGRLSHQYVMARFGDKGPYAIGNVKIITQGENTTECQLGRKPSKEARAKMRASAKGPENARKNAHKISAALKGLKKSPEHRAKLSKATLRAQVKMRREGRPIGRALANAKIVKEIRKQYTGKYGQVAKLARQYNLPHSVTLSICHRETWKHL